MPDKQEWLDLLLQHAVPETVARSCIRDVTDEAQLIAKIKALESPGEGVERLLQVLSFPVRAKRPWLNVFLSHGFPAEQSKAFLLLVVRNKGDLLYLEQTLRKHRPDLAETLTSKVCGEGWGGVKVCGVVVLFLRHMYARACVVITVKSTRMFGRLIFCKGINDGAWTCSLSICPRSRPCDSSMMSWMYATSRTN